LESQGNYIQGRVLNMHDLENLKLGVFCIFLYI